MQERKVDLPWERPDFITEIARLQADREAAPMLSNRRFSDRSVFCTLALAEWLGHAAPPDLLASARQLAVSGWFERRVFFIEQLGFIETTEARRISLPDATRFGAVHARFYERFGFELVPIGPATVAERQRQSLPPATSQPRTLLSTIFASSACEKGLLSLGRVSLPPGGSSA